jgi:hypothetical protein
LGRRHRSLFAFAMSAFEQVFEIIASVLFLVVGLSGTAFAYGLAGPKLVGGFHWSQKLQRSLRWLGPLLVVLCVASLVVVFK